MKTNMPKEKEDIEQTNTTAKKKKDPNLAERLVRGFLDMKLTGGTEGMDFYNRARQDNCTSALEDLKAYYRERSEGQDSESAAVIAGIKKEFLYREMVRTGAVFESKRKTLSIILSREFDLPKDTKKLYKEIEGFSLDTLGNYLQKRHLRRELIDRMFRENIGKHDMIKQFEKILGKKTLTTKQEKSIVQVCSSPIVAMDDLDEVLGLFSTLEEKQLIIKFFLPIVTLADLRDANVLSDQQVRDAIKQSIRENGLGTDFPLNKTDVEKTVDALYPGDNITVTTALFPGEVIDAIMSGSGKKEIRRAIQDANRETREEFRKMNDLGLEPDDQGRLLPSFVEKLRKDFGPKIAESFQIGGFIQGKKKLADGSIQSFHYAIDSIDDGPGTSVPDRANDMPITLKNILAGDNSSINKNWKQNPGERLSYAEMHKFIKEITEQPKEVSEKFKISTQADIDAAVARGDMKEKVLREDIMSLEDLKSALDTTDNAGAKYGLEKGTNIQVGILGEADFWVWQIQSVDGGKVTVSSGDGHTEELTYGEFFDVFESKNYKRLPKIESPEDFLAALQSHSPKPDAFKDIIYDTKRGFIPKDKKDDKDFPSITQFAGHNETISFPDGIDPIGKGWSKGEWEEIEKKDKKGNIIEKTGKYKETARHHKGGWNVLFIHFLDTRATPKISSVPAKAPGKIGKEMHDHTGLWGHVRGFMGHPSFHDIFLASKNMVDFLKHKMEHGSKLEAAKFQLALGKRLGFSPALMRELRVKVYGSTRELMEELIKEWSLLSTGDRSKEVYHILSNPKSHDYEVQAAVFTMLKKHGTLYVGESLLKYQGSFKFFERITGEKYNPNSDLVKSLVAKAEKEGVPPREELLIQYHLKNLGDKYECDSGLWGQVRDSWREGADTERESGVKQGSQLDQREARLTLMKNKLSGGEIAQGIGIMEKVWSKGGGPNVGPAMHLPAIYLTLSNIPKTLHTNQTDYLYNTFNKGHPYPALAFLRSEKHAELFQRVVKKLCENSKDPGMKASYATVESTRKSNDLGANINAIESFWNQYGTVLHKKLVMSQDPEILYRAEKENDGDCKAYVEHMQGFTFKRPFNPEEVEEGAFTYSHSAFTWNPYEHLRNMKFNQSSGMLNLGDPATEAAWKAFIEAMKDIKNIRVSEDPEKNTAFQLERFRKNYEAMNTILLENVPSQKFGDIKNEKYIQDLISALGFCPLLIPQESQFTSQEYMEGVTKDFQKYKNGNRTARDEKETVATSITELLSKK